MHACMYLWHPPVSSSPAQESLILLTLTRNRCASAGATYDRADSRTRTHEEPPLVTAVHASALCAKNQLAAASSPSRLSVQWSTLVWELPYEWQLAGRNAPFTPTVLQLLFSSALRMTDGTPVLLKPSTAIWAISCEILPHFKQKQGVLHQAVCQFCYAVAMMKHAGPSLAKHSVWACEQCHVVCQSMTGYFKNFSWMISLNKISPLFCLRVVVLVCVCVCLSLCVFVCAGAPGCRSPTPFSRATLSQRCGGSSVWAMPSCSVPLSSSWGACFSWPPRCFSWMTGRRPRNSKWLRHCLNNSSLFHLLFSHLFFKYLKRAWDVLHWLQKSKHTTSEEVAIILLLIWVPYRHTKVWDYISTVLCYLTPMLGFDVCQGQAAQWCQQWCQPCKTRKGPWANRKSQSAKSAPELTQAVLAINLLKCAYLDFYQLPPSHSCIHIFLFQTPKTWTQWARELVMALKG